MFSNYATYYTKPIKEPMSAPEIPYTNNPAPAPAPAIPVIPSPPDTTSLSDQTNTTASYNPNLPADSTTTSTSTSYSLPASYVLPVIDENSELLDDNEFNMLRIVINRIKKVDPKFNDPFDISAIIHLEIQTPQYTSIINNQEMTIKQKIDQLQKIMAMELNVVSDTAYKKNPYYMTNKTIFGDLIALNTFQPPQVQPSAAITSLTS